MFMFYKKNVYVLSKEIKLFMFYHTKDCLCSIKTTGNVL